MINEAPFHLALSSSPEPEKNKTLKIQPRLCFDDGWKYARFIDHFWSSEHSVLKVCCNEMMVGGCLKGMSACVVSSIRFYDNMEIIVARWEVGFEGARAAQTVRHLQLIGAVFF